jgi:hypothetical protein
MWRVLPVSRTLFLRPPASHATESISCCLPLPCRVHGRGLNQRALHHHEKQQQVLPFNVTKLR